MNIRKFFAVPLFTIGLAGCATQDIGRFINSSNNAATSATIVAMPRAAPAKPAVTKLDPLPLAAGVGPNCFTTPHNNFGGLLVYGGKDSQDRYYSCKAGAPLRMAPLFTNLNTQLIQHLCDISKPVVQSKSNGDLLVTCTYRGPEFVPSSVDGVRILVLK